MCITAYRRVVTGSEFRPVRHLTTGSQTLGVAVEAHTLSPGADALLRIDVEDETDHANPLAMAWASFGIGLLGTVIIGAMKLHDTP